MLEISLSHQTITKAKILSEELPSLRNSIERGAGNLAGLIGEVVAATVLNAKIQNTYDYDIITPDGERIDVKTKRCTSKPRLDYDCSIAAYNTKQRCDTYAFVRVLNDYTKAWYLGSLPKAEYFQKATKMKAGELDKSNNFTVKADCYNLKIESLNNEYTTRNQSCVIRSN
tara:strand:+ start:566 stop:1078 length:513 start_codon:yes stop_codon:yes gene_type:complete